MHWIWANLPQKIDTITSLSAPLFLHTNDTRQTIKTHVDKMRNRNVIHSSQGLFASPVLLVKKDGLTHFCIDYWALNATVQKDVYNLPYIDEILDSWHGIKFFSSLDLNSRYHQIVMDPALVEKTAFMTAFGTFEFLTMPFGLCNALATFQSDCIGQTHLATVSCIFQMIQ